MLESHQPRRDLWGGLGLRNTEPFELERLECGLRQTRSTRRPHFGRVRKFGVVHSRLARSLARYWNVRERGADFLDTRRGIVSSGGPGGVQYRSELTPRRGRMFVRVSLNWLRALF